MSNEQSELSAYNLSGRLNALNVALARMLDMLPPERMEIVLQDVHGAAKAAAEVAEADASNQTAAAFADGMIIQIQHLHRAIDLASFASEQVNRESR